VKLAAAATADRAAAAASAPFAIANNGYEGISAVQTQVPQSESRHFAPALPRRHERLKAEALP
jgi:hypothetical protein